MTKSVEVQVHPARDGIPDDDASFIAGLELGRAREGEFREMYAGVLPEHGSRGIYPADVFQDMH